MAEKNQRPRVHIRFRFNIESGEIEEFIIDDNAAHLPEEYHDKIADRFAAELARNPDIEDAGLRADVWGAREPQEPETQSGEDQERQTQERDKDTE
jgi:hypothetical protein